MIGDPARAALAETPEASQFTAAKVRIDDLSERSDHQRISTHAWERGRRLKRSGWLSPIEIKESRDPIGANPNRGVPPRYAPHRSDRATTWLSWRTISDAPARYPFGDLPIF